MIIYLKRTTSGILCAQIQGFLHCCGGLDYLNLNPRLLHGRVTGKLFRSPHLPLHQAPQGLVDPGLVTPPIFFEPRQDIRVQPKRYGLLKGPIVFQRNTQRQVQPHRFPLSRRFGGTLSPCGKLYPFRRPLHSFLLHKLLHTLSLHDVALKCMYNLVLKVFLQEHFVKSQPANPSRVSPSITSTSSASSFMKANASCGTGFCHTGANDCRCSGVGPNSRSAARCFGVL